MYDSLMECKERRRERLSRRNQRDRDRHTAESAQQREARLARRRVRDRAYRASRSAAQRERASIGSQERAISIRDPRPENESSQAYEPRAAQKTDP